MMHPQIEIKQESPASLSPSPNPAESPLSPSPSPNPTELPASPSPNPDLIADGIESPNPSPDPIAIEFGNVESRIIQIENYVLALPKMDRIEQIEAKIDTIEANQEVGKNLTVHLNPIKSRVLNIENFLNQLNKWYNDTGAFSSIEKIDGIDRDVRKMQDYQIKDFQRIVDIEKKMVRII